METQHFNPKTDTYLNCPCGCGAKVSSPATFILLEVIRAHFNEPVTITSGSRCKKYNPTVSTAEHSRHIEDDAVDIRVKNVPALEVYTWLSKQPYANLLGLAYSAKHNFTHIDPRGYYARWDY